MPEPCPKCGTPKTQWEHIVDGGKHFPTGVMLCPLSAEACRVKELEALTAQQAQRIEEMEDVLRALASQVGNGGYNAPTVDPEEFKAKISDGIEFLMRAEFNRALSLADLRAHEWWRHTGPWKSLREAIHGGPPAWEANQTTKGDPMPEPSDLRQRIKELEEKFERRMERENQLDEHIVEFWRKYGLGSKLPSSCFQCGKVGDRQITHMEIPDIYICAVCAGACAEFSAKDAKIAELEKRCGFFATLDNAWAEGMEKQDQGQREQISELERHVLALRERAKNLADAIWEFIQHFPMSMWLKRDGVARLEAPAAILNKLINNILEVKTSFETDVSIAQAVEQRIRAEEREHFRQIVSEVEDLYPASAFGRPPINTSPDSYSAAGARLACASIVAILSDRAEPQHPKET